MPANPLGVALRNRRAGHHALVWARRDLQAPENFTLASPAFDHGAPIPEKHRGRLRGANISPALNWTRPPAGTAEVVLIVQDPDVPFGKPATHALAVGIDPSLNGIPENALTNPSPLEATARAIEAATEIGCPVMVHIGGSYAPIEDILSQLRAGDIVTHAFTAWEPGIFDSDLQIIPAALEARARGVLFDVGHGAGSFAFRRGEAALADGFRPDTISSDLHRFNVDGPVFDLLTTMSKYLHLGLSLDEVLAMTTTAPAAALGRAGTLGVLGPGSAADVAVLRLEEGRFPFVDSIGATVQGRQRLVPVATFRRGRRVPVELSVNPRS